MITYLLQVAICWGLFLGLYHLTLRKETFFMVNRAYLLLTIVLGLAIPRMTWDTSMFMEQPTVEVAIDYLSYGFDQLNYMIAPTESTEEAIVETATPISILALIYWTGAILMLIKLVIGLVRIGLMFRKAEITYQDGQRIAYTNRDHAPFTFFNTVYLSTSRDDLNNDTAILIHEQAHVSGWHTLDVLFIELVKAFFWFNPLVYGYDHALKTVHEYIADANVLRRTALQRYGRLLLRQAQPGLEIALANHFYNHQLKERFKMMTRTPSQKRMLFKYLSVLPFILVVSLVFTNQSVQAEISKVEEMDLSELLPTSDKYDSNHLFYLLDQMQQANRESFWADYYPYDENFRNHFKRQSLENKKEIVRIINEFGETNILPVGSSLSPDGFIGIGKNINGVKSYVYPETYRYVSVLDRTDDVIKLQFGELGLITWLKNNDLMNSVVSISKRARRKEIIEKQKISTLAGSVEFLNTDKTNKVVFWNPLRFPFLKITKSTNAMNLKENTVFFQVKNKKGKIIYKNPVYSDSWNGSFNERRSIKDGAYDYKIVDRNGNITEGELIIKRIQRAVDIRYLLDKLYIDFNTSGDQLEDKLEAICETAYKLNQAHLKSEYGSIRMESIQNPKKSAWLMILGDIKDIDSPKKDLMFTLVSKDLETLMFRGSDFKQCDQIENLKSRGTKVYPKTGSNRNGKDTYPLLSNSSDLKLGLKPLSMMDDTATYMKFGDKGKDGTERFKSYSKNWKKKTSTENQINSQISDSTTTSTIPTIFDRSKNQYFNIERDAPFAMQVYNQWGNQVFNTKEYKNNWDGIWKGEPLPEATYFITITEGDKPTETVWVRIEGEIIAENISNTTPENFFPSVYDNSGNTLFPIQLQFSGNTPPFGFTGTTAEIKSDKDFEDHILSFTEVEKLTLYDEADNQKDDALIKSIHLKASTFKLPRKFSKLYQNSNRPEGTFNHGINIFNSEKKFHINYRVPYSEHVYVHTLNGKRLFDSTIAASQDDANALTELISVSTEGWPKGILVVTRVTGGGYYQTALLND